MIAFHCEEARDYCRAVIRRAKERGLLAQLVSRLQYLAGYSNQPGGHYPRSLGGGTRCYLWQDGREGMDFNFVMQRRSPGGEWTVWFNGGLIFHNGGWGVHT